MISYKLITQDAYANLQKNFEIQSSQKSVLLKATDELREKIDLMKQQIQNSQVQLQSERQKNKQLRNHIRLFQTKIQEITSRVASFILNQKNQINSFHDSSVPENNLLQTKGNLDLLCRILSKNIETLTEEYDISKQKQILFQQNQQLFLTTFNKLDAIITNLKQQKQKLILQIQQKQTSIQTLSLKLQKNAEFIQKLATQLQNQKENSNQNKIIQKRQTEQFKRLLQQNQISYEREIQRFKHQIQQNKIAHEKQIQQWKQQIQQIKIAYERQVQQCKQQIQHFKGQIQQFKESPISQLKDKLKAKEAWIEELVKNINQLKQRCIHLQMENSKTNSPYSFKSALRKEQAQRTKYLMICKQMVQQFNLKLSKIQQQKKQMEERYKTIKLKLNDYQYKEFKYKDKIGLYLQKIEKYEILTQKQQSEMEKLILQFDQELNNVIRMKEQEVKSKFEEQIEKYQQAISKLKEEQSHFKRNESQSDSRVLMKTQSLIDEISSPILNIQPQVQGKQKVEKSSNAAKELTKLKKQLQKAKKSKQSYKQKVIQLQKTCYNYSLEIRRYRGFIQQLYAEVQLKTNQNQKLKNALYKNGFVYHSLINNDQASITNSQGNISAIVKSENNGSGLKDRQSDLEYQISEIDTEMQRKNQRFLNQVLVNQHKSVKLSKYQDALDTAAYPLNISDQSCLQKNIKLGIDLSINQSILSVSKSLYSERSEMVSQVSLASSNPLDLSKNSPDNSFSSKNSYGIKSLYTEKSISSQNQNSFQAKSQSINQ